MIVYCVQLGWLHFKMDLGQRTEELLAQFDGSQNVVMVELISLGVGVYFSVRKLLKSLY